VDETTARRAIQRLVQLNGARGDYYRWLLEMAQSDDEKLRLYRAIVRAEPYDAKNYAALAGFELSLEPQTGAMESPLPTAVPGLNGVPELPSGNPATGSTELPPPRVYRQTPQPQETRRSQVDGRTAGSAEADYRHAIELDPCEPAYYYGLAEALERRSAFPLETMALNMALIGDPDNADYRAARARLP
jgi:hypothetical protein